MHSQTDTRPRHSIRYLSGHVRATLPDGVGVMLTPMMGNRLPAHRVWGADNGCFARPDAFDPIGFLGWLVKHRHAADRCLFATAPDVVGDARATLKQSLPYLPILRALGYKAALVAQDGIERLTVPWDALDALFIGGTDAWKLSERAYSVIAEAKARGKWVHAGRVNSLRRLRAMEVAGCDSADGTFIAFAPDANIPIVQGWVDAMREQPVLFRTIAPALALAAD